MSSIGPPHHVPVGDCNRPPWIAHLLPRAGTWPHGIAVFALASNDSVTVKPALSAFRRPSAVLNVRLTGRINDFRIKEAIGIFLTVRTHPGNHRQSRRTWTLTRYGQKVRATSALLGAYAHKIKKHGA
jgi:hypothetical protein